MKRKFLLLCFFLTFLICQVPVKISPSASHNQTHPTITPTSIFTLRKTLPTSNPTPKTATATPTLFTPITSGPVYYTVQEGDTMATIAVKLGIDVTSLTLANHITNIDYIKVGQQLLVATEPILIPTADIKEGKEIVVVLSLQRVFAFEDGVLQRDFPVGSGKPSTPTVTGPYKIESKYEFSDMSGPDYFIKDVPWVMYFHEGYSFHGAKWNPELLQTSHGCLNMNESDAKQLFEWAPLGTPVQIYP